MMAGVMLVVMGLARLGKLMEFVPHPVTTGFTMGIAVVIAVLQLKYAFGVTLPHTEGDVRVPRRIVGRAGNINPWRRRSRGAHARRCCSGCRRCIKRVPAPLIASLVVAVARRGRSARCCRADWHFHATTIGSHVQLSTRRRRASVTAFRRCRRNRCLPWHFVDPAACRSTTTTIRELLPSAFAIAMLGAIESLMAAVVADGMSGTQHDPNAELISLGIGNILCPFFGGDSPRRERSPAPRRISAPALARRCRPRCTSIFVLACTIALAPLVAYLPMAALAGC